MQAKTTRSRRGSPWITRMISNMEEKLHADHRTVSGEDVRNWMRKRRYSKPAHHNAYGALIRVAVMRGILTPTGRFTRMRGERSHNRITPLYRVTKPRVAD